MMNQAASATRRPSSASTATAGCCPMIVHPQFFMNTFAAQAPLPPPSSVQQCLLGSQPAPPQTSLTSTATTATTNAAQTQTPRATANSTINASTSTNGPLAGHLTIGNEANISLQQQHQTATRQEQQAPANYNSSTSLAHLLSNPHLNNCMALAATLATLHQTHQLQHAHHHHHQSTPINHPQLQQQPQPQPNPSASQTVATNQVPLLNFNSYTSAPFLNNAPPPPPSTTTTQQPASTGAPLAAHLNLSSSQQQQATTNLVTSTTNNSNVAITSSQTSQAAHYPGQRPLAINTTLNSVANQQQQISYRPSSQLQQQPQQQAVPTLTPPQLIRSLVSDELSNLVSEHFSTLVFNHILASGLQFAQPVNPNVNPSRNLAPNAVLNQQAAPVASTHLTAPNQQQQPPIQQQQPIPPPLQQPNDGNVNEQHAPPHQPQQQNYQSQTNTAQIRLVQVPPQPPATAPVPPQDTYTSTTSATTNPIYQQHQQHVENLQATSNPAPEPMPPLHPLQSNAAPQHQPASQQHHNQSIPPPPPLFYGFNTMNQALALLASTSQVQPQTMFSQIFNLYLQNGLTPDTHLSHHAHHPPHHYHHHLHGNHHHHHHHHGPNGQNNGQDDTMLTISESKPKGLSRADIDSLTPYIQMNEKDSRTCVICLSRFELKSKIRPLPCNHAFHAKCVDKWLRANRTCPICRRDAMKTYGAKIKRI